MSKELERLAEALRILAKFNDELAVRHIIIFLLVASHDGITVTEICDKTGFPQSTVSRAIIGMHKDPNDRTKPGLVDVIVDDIDHRKKMVHVAPLGRRVLKNISEAIA